MTLPVDVAKLRLSTDGATKVFALTGGGGALYAASPSDLVAFHTPEGGAPGHLAYGADFTISGDITTGSASLTTVAADALAAGVLTVGRLTPLLQAATFREGDGNPSARFESTSDLGRMIDQEAAEAIGRSLQQPYAEAPRSMALPYLSSRAGRALGFDGAGNVAVSGSSLAAIDAAAALAATSALAGTLGAIASTAALLGLFGAAVGLVDGTAFLTAGRDRPGDGGGALFTYDAADTTTADNHGTVRVDGQGRRFKALLCSPLRPEVFGAQGDAITFTDASVEDGESILTTDTTVIPPFAGSKLVSVPGYSGTATWVDAHTLALGAPVTGTASNVLGRLATDDTVALQETITAAGEGGAVLYSRGYGVKGTLSVAMGQQHAGTAVGLAPNTTNQVRGSQLIQFDLGDIPLLQANGADDAHNLVHVYIAQLGLVRCFAGSTGIGYLAHNSRASVLDRLLVTGFNVGIEQGLNCWAWSCRQVTIFDAASKGLYKHDEGEDSTYLNLFVALYSPGGTCVYIGGMSQTDTFINPYFSSAAFGVFIDQKDNVGDGSGTPFPMQITLTNPASEDLILAQVAAKTSNENADAKYHPRIIIDGGRSYISGSWGPAVANSGNALVWAQHASAVIVTAPFNQSLSYGLVLGQGFGDFTFTGTPVGEWDIQHDVQSTYGTAQVIGGAASLGHGRVTPGDRPYCRMAADAMTGGTGVGGDVVPFDIPVEDVLTWRNAAAHAIVPNVPGGRTCDVLVQLFIPAAAIGDYSLYLFKDGVLAQLLDSASVSVADKPLTLHGFGKIAAAAGGSFTVVLGSTVDATIDTGANNSFFSMELAA